MESWVNANFVTIRVPYTIKNPGPPPFLLYVIVISSVPNKWSLNLRHPEIYNAYKKIVKELTFGNILPNNIPTFPIRKWTGSRHLGQVGVDSNNGKFIMQESKANPDVIEQHRQELEYFLQKLFSLHVVQSTSEFRNILGAAVRETEAMHSQYLRLSTKKLQAVQLLQRKVRSWQLQLRFIVFVQVIVARLRQHKLVCKYKQELVRTTAAKTLQRVWRSYLLRKKWRVLVCGVFSRVDEKQSIVHSSFSVCSENKLNTEDQFDAHDCANNIKYEQTESISGTNLLGRQQWKSSSALKPQISAALPKKLLDSVLFEVVKVEASQEDYSVKPKNTSYSKMNLRETLIFSYRIFLCPRELFDLLILRYNTPSPTENKTQQRVIQFFKAWIVLMIEDFLSPEDGLEPLLLASVTQEKVSQNTSLAILPNFLAKMKKEHHFKQIMYCDTTKIGKSIASISDEIFGNVVEVARQMALIDHMLFREIQLSELSGLAWLTSQKTFSPKSPTINAMIMRFNQLSLSVCTEILKYNKVEGRVKAIVYFLKLATQCRILNNFHALLAIIAGLSHVSVLRLRNTWAAVPTRWKHLHEELNQLMAFEQNYKRYREVLSEIPPLASCLPYIGVFLTDLVFINEGNPTKIENGKVNLNKLRLIAETVRKIKMFQQKSFPFRPNEALQRKLLDCEASDERSLYLWSTKLEPARTGLSTAFMREE